MTRVLKANLRSARILTSVLKLSRRFSVHIVCPSILSLSNLELREIILWITFNPYSNYLSFFTCLIL